MHIKTVTEYVWIHLGYHTTTNTQLNHILQLCYNKYLIYSMSQGKARGYFFTPYTVDTHNTVQKNVVVAKKNDAFL